MFLFSGKKQLSLLDNLMIYSNISQHFFSPGHSIGYTYKSNYKLCLTSSGDSCQSPWLSPTQECGFPTLSCPLLTQCRVTEIQGWTKVGLQLFVQKKTLTNDNIRINLMFCALTTVNLVLLLTPTYYSFLYKELHANLLFKFTSLKTFTFSQLS